MGSLYSALQFPKYGGSSVTGQPSLSNTGRGLSQSLWADCPRHIENPAVGYGYFEDFTGPLATATTYGFTLTNATTGTFAVTDGAGGLVLLDAGAATNDQGVVSLQQTQELWTPAANATLWFEARLKVSSVAGQQYFVGLHDIDTSIMASGAKDEGSGAYFIGFYQDANTATATYLEFGVCENASIDIDIDAATIAADTYIKLGFKVRGTTAGSLSVDSYVNGAFVRSMTDGDDVPEADMALSFACVNEDGANRNTMTVDWVAIAQLNA